MRRTALEFLVTAAVSGGCATGRVNPDEMSAADHREAAIFAKGGGR